MPVTLCAEVSRSSTGEGSETVSLQTHSSQASISEEEISIWVDEMEEQNGKRQKLNETVHYISDGRYSPLIGSLSTRTFEGDAAVIERLRLGRGLLRMTYPGLPTLCCRRRRELSWLGGVVKVVSDLKLISSPYCALSRVCLQLLFCFMLDVTKCSISHLLTWSKFKLSCQPPFSRRSSMLYSSWYITWCIDTKSHAFGVRLTLFDPISRNHAIQTKYHSFFF